MAQGLKFTRELVIVLLISLVVAFAGILMFGRTVKADESGDGWTLTDDGVLTITDEVAFSGDEFGWKAEDIIDKVKTVIISCDVYALPDDAFSNCTELTTVKMTKVNCINSHCFDNCKKLSSVEAGELTEIKASAFEHCESLKTIELSNVYKISENAFCNCESLLKVDLSNVTEIGDRAFLGCYDLYSVTSLANVTYLGEQAFSSCSSLEGTIDLSGVRKIPSAAFDSSAIEEVIVSSAHDVTIGTFAFESCLMLNTVTGDKIVSVGKNAFSGCMSLSNIDLSHVKTVGSSAFAGCNSLETVDLRCVESIGESAFKYTPLKYITVSVNFEPDRNFPRGQILERYFIGSIGQDPERNNDAILGGFYPNAKFYYTEWDVGLYIDGTLKKYTVLKGEKFARPEDPAKDGFAFTGWYTDRACTKLYDFDNTVTDTLILYAGWAQDLGSQVFKGYTITLGGQIGVNFYTILPDEAKKTDYILFTVEGLPGMQKVYVADAETISLNGAKYDVFVCRVPAKNMTSKITADLYISGSKAATTDYSVRRYADQIIANPSMYNNAWPLVRAMLNYGAYAQEYFNFKTDDLANAGINNSGYSIDDLTFSKPYDPSKSNLPDYLAFTGVSLTLESNTVLKLQFTKNVPMDLTYVFRLEKNGTETVLPYEVSGDNVTVRITGIPADRLDEDFHIRISVVEDQFGANYFVAYSPMTYASNIINRELTAERNQALKNLMKALYRYNEAAKEYKKF